MIGRPGLDLHGLNALSGLTHCLAPPPAGKGCKKKLFCIRQNVSNLNLKFIEPEMEEKRREEGGGGRNPVFVKQRKPKKFLHSMIPVKLNFQNKNTVLKHLFL